MFLRRVGIKLQNVYTGLYGHHVLLPPYIWDSLKDFGCVVYSGTYLTTRLMQDVNPGLRNPV